MMQRAVWLLFAIAIISWGVCVTYPTSDIHFGWIGTLFGSSAGLIATISSYQTEDKADTRGGVIYKKDSPVKFFIAYTLVGLLFVAFLFGSALGSMGLFK